MEVGVHDTQLPEELDDARLLAKFLHVSVSQIRKMTRLTDLPRVYVGRRAVRYDRPAVLAWLKEREVAK